MSTVEELTNWIRDIWVTDHMKAMRIFTVRARLISVIYKRL